MAIVITTNKRPHRHEELWMDGHHIKKDRKSNLHHNSTKCRRSHQLNRREKEIEKGMMSEGITWNIDLRELFDD